MREQKERRLARAAADPSLIPHGTKSAYINWDCRCQQCKDAYREVRGGGATATSGLPWTSEQVAMALSNRPIAEIAAQLGRSYQAVVNIRYRRRPRPSLDISSDSFGGAAVDAVSRRSAELANGGAVNSASHVATNVVFSNTSVAASDATNGDR
ncbi:hypothetical protein ABZ801_01255 [Actinomadura sp. NPDC047616]|uniref:hypothetical protein n=1 Tax=Actinomadura sp. NPDC047616 TaxID=3155914 RepID=UPI0033F7A4CA